MYKQIKEPVLNIPATIGWCLQYVDDAVNAPLRQPSATISYNIEKENGNIKNELPPVDVWVPIFYKLSNESNGHVAWHYGGDGKTSFTKIRDSNQTAMKTKAYDSIDEQIRALKNWVGGKVDYLGWSSWIDGIHVVKWEDDVMSNKYKIGDILKLRAEAYYDANGLAFAENEAGNIVGRVSWFEKKRVADTETYAYHFFGNLGGHDTAFVEWDLEKI